MQIFSNPCNPVNYYSFTQQTVDCSPGYAGMKPGLQENPLCGSALATFLNTLF